MTGGLRLAVGLLTVIPVRPPAEIGRTQARTAMLLAPLAILPVALLAAGVGAGAGLLGLPAALAGTLVVAVLALGTRAMHLDGLADTTDGLGSGRAPDEALAIMRRGEIGPMGTVALILALLTQALAAGEILTRPWGWLQLAVLVGVSRGALALACVTPLPSARPDGLGRLVAGSVPVPAAITVWVLLGASAVGAALLTGQSWWLPLAGVAAALLSVWWLLARAVRRLGGITGDVLGAVVEIAASVLLVVAAVGPS